MRRLNRLLAALLGFVACCGTARGQNDWQFPDPYFGAFQHRQAGTPQAERKYRAEIAPQQPRRLHESRRTPPHATWWQRLRQRKR